MNHRRNLAAAAVAAALLAAAPALLAETLTIGFADPVSSADPQLNNHAGDRSLALHFWDSLVESRDGGKLEPALAKSWKALDDKTWIRMLDLATLITTKQETRHF